MKTWRIPFILITVCLALALFASCGDKTPPVADGRLTVAVTIAPERAFVQAVCGDSFDVLVVVPPGYSPEVYEPTPRDMARFSDAEIYFSIGMPVEETGIFDMLPKSTSLISLDEAAREEYADLDLGGGRDPHIWLSPKRAMVVLRKIAQELGALDPDNAGEYAKNAEAYIAELEAADARIKELFSGVTQRGFIVFHPAFGYFAEEYGLTMYALEEHGKEATAARLMEMADFAKAQGIKTVFYQAEVDGSQARAFAEEIGGVTVMLDPLSGDYINNLMIMAQAIAEGA